MSELKDKVILEIKKIYDPEIPVNIYELGLIYKIDIKDEKKVKIEMTLSFNSFIFFQLLTNTCAKPLWHI